METPPEVQGVLIFIAKRLADAQRLEEVFKAAGLDYAVEPDHFTSGAIFRTSRIGAFFYVDPADRKKAVETMLENDFVPIPDPTAELQ
jgi:hypothetical protein